MKTLVSLTAFLALCSCASTVKNNESTEYSRIFNAPFESVWRATQQALLNYPMNVNNMDTGFLQTLYITGKYRFQAPHKEGEALPSGYQYRININIQKGDERTKVTVFKEVRQQVDFFTNPKDKASDGFEEKSILYRILREIQIEKRFRKDSKPAVG